MLGTFLASETRILGRLLESHGLDPLKICRQGGLDYTLAGDPAARVPFARVVSAWNHAADVLKRPDIGLEAAKHYRATDFHGIAVVFLASPTLHKALDRLARYLVVVNTAVSIRIETDEDSIDAIYSTIDLEPGRRRALEDSRAAILADLSRSSASGTLDPSGVEFTYPAPDDASAYEDFFRCRVVFGAPQWRMSWRLADADRPFIADNRDLARANDRILDRAVKNLRPDTLVARVKLEMIDELPSGKTSEDTVAQAMGMSGRSLQRRLAEEGASYKDILGEVRRDLARQYVEESDESVTDISFLLGFADVSSFSRAFKRWYGVSPAAARQTGVAES